MPGFNPTLVRLRPPEGLQGPHRHKGFQSHAGSIEAQEPPTQVGVPQKCFNPTLVRLRRLLAAVGRTLPPARFNPTLVRLRQAVRGRLRAAWVAFQSHAGSIEAAFSTGP